jgi:hypothetical protein
MAPASKPAAAAKKKKEPSERSDRSDKESKGKDGKKRKKKKGKKEEEKPPTVKDKLKASLAKVGVKVKAPFKKLKAKFIKEKVVDPNASLVPVDPNKKGKMERAMELLCCIYCRAPKVAYEETPEERERREMVERLVALREKEVERLALAAKAAETVTVVYCDNSKFLLDEWLNPPPSPVEEVKEKIVARKDEEEKKTDEPGVLVIPVEVSSQEGEGAKTEVDNPALAAAVAVEEETQPPPNKAVDDADDAVANDADDGDDDDADADDDDDDDDDDESDDDKEVMSEPVKMVEKKVTRRFSLWGAPKPVVEPMPEPERVPTPPPVPPSPRALFYKAAHAHSYETVFGDRQAPLIYMSKYHTPQTGAPEFVRAITEYALNYVITKRDMSTYIVNLQCAARIRKARVRVKERAAEKVVEDSAKANAVAREKDEWNKGYDKFTLLCNAFARRTAHVATNYWRIPAAATGISRSWRGYRVRVRIPDFRKRVLAQRQRRLERARYLRALEMAYGSKEDEKLRKEQTARRQYSRRTRGSDKFDDSYEHDRGGWKPEFEASGDLDIWSHVWKPPQGSQFGVRNYKVKLPPKSFREAKTLVEDRNSWIGVPVMLEKAKSKERTLGPPDRINTMKKYAHVKSTIPRAPGNPTMLSNRSGDDNFYALKYNWIPMNIIEKGKKIPILEAAYEKYKIEKQEHDHAMEEERRRLLAEREAEDKPSVLG